MNNYLPSSYMPNVQEEEEARRRQALAKQSMTPSRAPQVKLSAQDNNPWGKDKQCLGLKILSGVLGLIVVILIIVLVIKMVGHKKEGMGSPAKSDGELPMSIQGGFNFANESLMSTSI